MTHTEFEILRASYEPLHRCRLPGFFERHRLKIKDGARIRCECAQVWEWRDTGWYERQMEWVRIDANGQRIWPKPPPDPIYRRYPFEVGDKVRRIDGGDIVGEVTRVYLDRCEVQVYWNQGVPWNYSRLAYTSVERVEV